MALVRKTLPEVIQQLDQLLEATAHRLAWSNEVEFDLVLVGTGIQNLRLKFALVVRLDNFWIAIWLGSPVKCC